MTQDQDERGSIVIDDRGRLRRAERRKTLLQIGRASASRATGKTIFEVAVIRSDARHRCHHVRSQRSAAKVGVNQDPRAVDERPNAGRAQFAQRIAHNDEHSIERGYRLLLAKRREFPAHHSEDNGARQFSIAERLQDLFNGRNRAELSLLHAMTRMRGFAERTMRPITAAQSVCAFSRRFITAF